MSGLERLTAALDRTERHMLDEGVLPGSTPGRRR